MRKLFVGNFSFEDRGTAPLKGPPARLAAELAVVWLSVAEDGDEIFCPETISDDFWERMSRLTGARVRGIRPESLGDTAAEMLVPWGHTPETRSLAGRLRLRIEAPPQAAVWQVNSREFAWTIEQFLGVALPGSAPVRTLKELESHLLAVRSEGDRWIIKSNLSQSGRGQLRVSGAILTDEQSRWVERRLRRQQVLVVEPFLDRVAELGVQWDIPEQAPPRLLGMTRLHVNDRGAYLGTSFDIVDIPPDIIDSILATQQTAVVRLREAGYFGPLGIDAMIHRRSDGRPVGRALQDINARWTMGRIAWEWRRRLGNEAGGPGAFLMAASPPYPDAVALSPDLVGEDPCRWKCWWCPGEFPDRDRAERRASE